jgi:uncharacterized membrane protein
MEPVQIQVPRMVPQEHTVMVPQHHTEHVQIQVPRQVVQEVQTHTVPQVSYQQYQTTSAPMTMNAAPTTAYAAPTTSYAAPTTYGGSMVGGFGGGMSIGGFGGRVF